MAIAGLVIALLDKGRHSAHQATVGMLAGCAGMIVYAALAVPLLRRLKAPHAAAVALTGWFAAAGIALLPVLLA